MGQSPHPLTTQTGWVGRVPWVTLGLAGLVLLVHALKMSLSGFGPLWARSVLGSSTRWELLSGELHRLVSASFVHGGAEHLMTNLASFLVLGAVLESALRRGFFWTVILGSSVATFLLEELWLQSALLASGLSAPIFGLAGGYLGTWLRARELLPRVHRSVWSFLLGLFSAGAFLVYGLSPSLHATAAGTGLVLGLLASRSLLGASGMFRRGVSASAGVLVLACVCVPVVRVAVGGVSAVSGDLRAAIESPGADPQWLVVLALDVAESDRPDALALDLAHLAAVRALERIEAPWRRVQAQDALSAVLLRQQRLESALEAQLAALESGVRPGSLARLARIETDLLARGAVLRAGPESDLQPALISVPAGPGRPASLILRREGGERGARIEAMLRCQSGARAVIRAGFPAGGAVLVAPLLHADADGCDELSLLRIDTSAPRPRASLDFVWVTPDLWPEEPAAVFSPSGRGGVIGYRSRAVAFGALATGWLRD